ncbi:DUF488 family protein [Niabella aurantiaca]|uniref:DUF488 domain-containing protein n=1 Tax=Niabella aurantiaca TaxID=379900 RepID=UPI001FE0FE35|nr:DUF488 domain-containing protein [Niabella aurantiaca]
MGGTIEKIVFQKLLFLLVRQQQVPAYDFIPYKYGCFSYSATADVTAMSKKGLLADNDTCIVSNDKKDYFKELQITDQKHLLEIKKLYGGMSANALMRHTYLNYPYWAINSIKASDILTEEQLQKVHTNRPKDNRTILFTIGYEGISLEEYLNRLIRNDVKVLVDVRNNPVSMKYGFSGSQLKRYCGSLNIQYLHFPEVGIRSEQRQELKTQKDYDELFEIYKKSNLTKTIPSQEKIYQLLQQHQRIALTCFEANICQCHRKHLAEAIQSLPGFAYDTKHI